MYIVPAQLPKQTQKIWEVTETVHKWNKQVQKIIEHINMIVEHVLIPT